MRRVLEAILLVALLSIGLPAFAQNQTARVIADRTNLREKPTTDSTIVVAVSKGDELEVLERSGTWYRVRVKSTGREGYVSSLVIEVQPGTGAAAPPRPAPVTPAPPPAAAPPAQRPATPAAAADMRAFIIRVYGGLFPDYGTTGFGGGGGGAKRLANHEEMEIQVDAIYSVHPGYLDSVFTDASLRVLRVSGNFIYNFVLPDKNWKPFAGGGLVVTHGSWNLDSDFGEIDYDGGFNSGVNLQVLGGIEKPLAGKKSFRAEIRFGPFGTALLAGLSF